MITDPKKRAGEQERERIEKYESRRKENEIYYRELSVDQILEEVERKLPGCPEEMCFACLSNEVLINELRRRIGGEIDE